MRISATEDYGLRCLLVLARKGPDEQLSVSDIAEMEGISEPYASKLLSILRKAGLVRAARGRKGGFCITREPAEIDILEVITALGGPLIDPDHCSRRTGQLDHCVHGAYCPVYDLLSGVAGYVGEFLGNTSLRDVIEGEIPRITHQTDRLVHLTPGKSRGEKRVWNLEKKNIGRGNQQTARNK